MSNRQLRREQRRLAGQGGRATSARRPRRPAGGGGGSGGLFSLPYLITVGVIVLALIGVLVYFATRPNEAEAEAVASLRTAMEEIPRLKEEGLIDGTSMGRADAPLQLDMFEDFQCPFCLRFTAFVESEFIDEFIRTGQLRITYRHFPVFAGRESVQAAQASECAAEQNAFWEYHHKLFLVQAEAGQLERERIEVGRFSDENLKRYAEELGLDMEQFNTCFDTDRYLEKVQQDKQEGTAYGITGTPGFVLNGRPLIGGAPSDIEGWKALFEQVLAEASPTPTSEEGDESGTPSSTP